MNRAQRRAARRSITTLRRRPGYLSPEGRKHPEEYSPGELRIFLVHDAVRSHPTDLQWASVAYQRIGDRERIGAEAAFVSVRDEVLSLTGRGMPTEEAPF